MQLTIFLSLLTNFFHVTFFLISVCLSCVSARVHIADWFETFIDRSIVDRHLRKTHLQTTERALHEHFPSWFRSVTWGELYSRSLRCHNEAADDLFLKIEQFWQNIHSKFVSDWYNGRFRRVFSISTLFSISINVV